MRGGRLREVVAKGGSTIFQFFCSLFVVKRYDVDECLNLAGPSEIGYHIHLVEHSTRVGVLLIAVTPC